MRSPAGRVLVASAMLATTACDDRPLLIACTDDLRGVYLAEAGERWMVLDHRATLEAYPLFDDVGERPAELEVAPRVLDLRRTGDELAGEMRRRYLRGRDRCEARASARVTSCAGEVIEIVLADPLPPTSFTPCTWGPSASSRRERWRRVPNHAAAR